MSIQARTVLCVVVVMLLFVSWAGALPAHAAEPAASPAGHWEGEVKLPGTKLAIRVDLQHADAGWSGTVDIPVQALRGFQLDAIKINGNSVEFAMPNIPGDPVFRGKLAADGESIDGELSQSGMKFPFTIARKEQPAEDKAWMTAGVPGEGLAGFWSGTLKPTPLIQLRLSLEITTKEDGQFAGELISLDQGSARIPLTATVKEGGEVDMQVSKVGGSFKGRFNEKGSELSGHWRQGGGDLPLTFKRQAKATELKRPQEPRKPYPYEEEQVEVPTPADDVKLAGTFTVPRDGGPHPAVVLVSGSGPQDRDEALMGHRPFLVLADHLTRNGIAVLRYDDRGIGKSTGDFGKATHSDFVEDALAAVDWLKARPEVDPQRIGIVGHSEGGIVAPLAAAKRPDDVAFIVMLAGVGVPMEQLLLRQGADMGRIMGQVDSEIEKQAKSQRKAFSLLRSDADQATLEKAIREVIEEQLSELKPEEREAVGISDAFAESQAKVSVTPWFRQLIAYDPRPALLEVKCPVLAINGEKDIQVAAEENLAGIQAALAEGGNADVTIKEFPGLNHLFQHCTTGSVSEYGEIEETFAPEALETVSEWIRQRAGE
jgi:hypothetical protein